MRIRRCLLGLWMCATAACTREVASGLDEAEANRAVVTLSRAGVDCEKASDSTTEGRYKIVVARDEAVAAIATLAAEEIPRLRPAAGGSNPLIASPEAERAARIAAVAAQIERSLTSIDGIQDARVHLDVPVQDPLLTAMAPKDATIRPTASVLVRHRGPTPPVTDDDVRRLTAGAVAGLAPADVVVVPVAVKDPGHGRDRDLARIGPLSMARSSVPAFRWMALTMLGVVGVLGLVILALLVQLKRRERAGTAAAEVT